MALIEKALLSRKALALVFVLLASVLLWPAAPGFTWMAGGEPAPRVGGPRQCRRNMGVRSG